jgi:hypothetical protein|tara:strand:- start:166 stop:882 length:717 start_codon:yes stop_codon:yes gene_type:complete
MKIKEISTDILKWLNGQSPDMAFRNLKDTTIISGVLIVGGVVLKRMGDKISKKQEEDVALEVAIDSILGAENENSNKANIMLYSAYRDTINEFLGQYDTLEEAENRIYEIELENFLDERRTVLDKLNDPNTDWDREYSSKEETQIYFDKYLSDIEAEKKMIRKMSQTPKGSILQGALNYAPYIGSDGVKRWLPDKMFDGYSQRHKDGGGNFPYIIFDPSFKALTIEEMKERNMGREAQ